MYTLKRRSLTELPPTSDCLQGHLLRCHYVIRLCTTLLESDKFTIQPISFGWIKKGSVLCADKCFSSMPADYFVTCGCSTCVRNCRCRMKDVQCTEYCKCGDRCNNVL